MEFSVRAFTPQDLAAFTPLARAAGLAAAIDYMGDYLAWQPDGYLCGVNGNGHMVSAVGAQRYGHAAFIGAMCVDPAQQRQGLGGHILAELLQHLDEVGVTTSLLEATTMGQGLYAKMGFVAEHETGVFRRTNSAERTALPRCCQPLTTADLDAVTALDARCTGLLRPRVIHGLAAQSRGRAFITRSSGGALTGYIMANPTRMGPWVAETTRAEDGEALLDAALSLPFEDAPVIYTPLCNQRAVQVLERRGFTCARTMKRMRRGPAVACVQEAIHALGTAGVG